jgi:hypothetical protein
MQNFSIADDQLQQLGYLIAYEARKIIKIEAVTTQSGAW